MSKPTEEARQRAVREWQDAPAVNPRYQGATPAQVGRALLRRPARHATENNDEGEPAVKSSV